MIHLLFIHVPCRLPLLPCCLARINESHLKFAHARDWGTEWYDPKTRVSRVYIRILYSTLEHNGALTDAFNEVHHGGFWAHSRSSRRIMNGNIKQWYVSDLWSHTYLTSIAMICLGLCNINCTYSREISYQSIGMLQTTFYCYWRIQNFHTK